MLRRNKKKQKLGRIAKFQKPLAKPLVIPPQVPVSRESPSPQNATLPIDLLIKKALSLMHKGS